MSTTARALFALVPRFMVAMVMLWVASTQGSRAILAVQANDLAAAASSEGHLVGAASLMCLGPALWIITARPEST